MDNLKAQPLPADLNPLEFIEAQSWTLAPEHTLTKRLLERKLSAETIAHFQIAPHGNGWIYPASGGQRWKNYDSNADPKYAWIGGKPESAEIYSGPDLMQAITIAAGACWLVSGEPDVWALRSAGINHSLSGFTESHAPKELALFLASLGVTVLYIAPDLDPAGERWARKIAAALEGSPIELDCRALPADLGAKGDIGKAWQQYNKLMPFERWLTGLNRYYPEPEKIDLIAQPTTGGEKPVIPEDYRLEIIALFGVGMFGSNGFAIKPNGKAKNLYCPFHSDKHPSASMHQFKGLYCHTEGTWYSWQKLGEKIGLGSIAEWREARTYATNSQQLTTELRETLINIGATCAARVIDLLYSLGWKAGRIFSRAEAAQALAGKVSSWTLRAALEPASAKDKDTIKSKNIYCGIFPPFIFTTNTMEKSLNKSKGRPSKLYIMPSLSQIAQALGSKIGSHNDTIKPEKLTKQADYRAEVYAALPRRKAGTYARKTLSQRIGITTRTAQNYDKRAALLVTERFKKEPVLLENIAEMQGQPEADKKRNTWLENGETITAGKRAGKPLRFPASVEGYERALANSPTGKVWLVIQLTNHYQAGHE